MKNKMAGLAGAAALALGLLMVPFAGDVLAETKPGQAKEEKAKSPHGASPHGNMLGKPAKFQPEKIPKIVAVVDKVEVKREVFVRIMNSVVGDMVMKGMPLTDETLKQMQTRVLDHLVTSELLFAEGKKEKVAVDEKAVGDQFTAIAGRFKDEQEFKKNLKEQKMTEAELKDDIRKNMVIMRLVDEKVIKGISVSEEESKKYYNEHTEEFKVPEQVRAKHIILRSDPKDDAAKKAETRKKMEDIQAKLKAGEKFEDLAKAHSQDGSSASGGDLGLFPRGVMVPEFEDAAFKMKEGEVSDIVTSPFGLHIIKLEEKKPAGLSQYDEVKKDIIQGLESEIKREKVGKYIASLKAKAKIKLNL